MGRTNRILMPFVGMLLFLSFWVFSAQIIIPSHRFSVTDETNTPATIEDVLVEALAVTDPIQAVSSVLNPAGTGDDIWGLRSPQIAAAIHAASIASRFLFGKKPVPAIQCGTFPKDVVDGFKDRYQYLWRGAANHTGITDSTSKDAKHQQQASPRTFIALNLHNSEEVIPTLMRNLLRLIDVLGPSNVFLSVYENGSKDRTQQLLRVFETLLNHIGVPNSIVTSDEVSDYKKYNRIDVLSRYRNLAIQPMFKQPVTYDRIFFVNDVYHCLDDTLEIVHQYELQSADITCGFDYWKNDIWFYDTWVARSISGNILREFWYQGTFAYDPPTRARYEVGLPVQAYSCWNGMAMLRAGPFYKKNVRFRLGNSTKGECAASECQLIAKDFWEHGYGRVVMTPMSRVVYDLPLHADVRAKKLDLIHVRSQLSTMSRYADTDGQAATKRKQRSEVLGLSREGGRRLFDHDKFLWRSVWLGWRHEPLWVTGADAQNEVIRDWVYPGPKRVMCFGMEGPGNPDADWWHPVYEIVPYASKPAEIDRKHAMISQA